MRKFVLLGILCFSLVFAERWPDQIIVDGCGVRWIDNEGNQKFYDNEHALTATGVIPFVRSVVCEKEEDSRCTYFYNILPKGRENEFCFKLKCTAVPSNDKVQVLFNQFEFGHVVRGDNEELVFIPEKVHINLKAIDHLSFLWYL